MPKFLTTITLELEVEVEYSWAPGSPPTSTSPPEPASVEIRAVTCGKATVPPILWEDQHEELEKQAFENLAERLAAPQGEGRGEW